MRLLQGLAGALRTVGAPSCRVATNSRAIPRADVGSTNWHTSSPQPISQGTCRRFKGDYGFNVFHNSNPQHGGSYARHERRMREDEVEDFHKSVKGWLPVWGTPPPNTSLAYVRDETVTGEICREREQQHRDHDVESGMSAAPAPPPLPVRGGPLMDAVSVSSSSAGGEMVVDDPYAATVGASADGPPEPSFLTYGDEAIMKTFSFPTYREAYLFMGRLWAFCYGCDKYPQVIWNHMEITVYLYSPSFKGLSKREARVAAFLNDQYNMFKKSRMQREKVLKEVVERATVEEVMGEEVRQTLQEREAQRRAKVTEAVVGPQRWAQLLENGMKLKEEEYQEGAPRGEEAKKRSG
eukprot:gene11708-8055_t